MQDGWTEEELDQMKARMDRAKEVIAMPLHEKLKTVNEYLVTNGSNIQITETQLGSHRGKHSLLDCIYMNICKPHKINILT